MAPKIDGLGALIDPGALYYVQDTRTYSGDSILWWGIANRGYVCNLDKAGVYPGSEMRSMRDTDLPWPVGFVLQHTQKHVCAGVLGRAATDLAPIRETEG